MRCRGSFHRIALRAAAVHSIATHGLPPLGPRRASSSQPAENREHAPAQLQQRPFGVLHPLELQTGRSSYIWGAYDSGDLQSWASEMDIQQLVKAVLQDAITAANLGHLLKCYHELSIFKLRPDIWVVMNERGVPVGVCEVKKPGSSIMDSPVVHGQIYDYMLRLRSFHGIKHVFGIVSTYHQWRLYWLEDCAAAAAAAATVVTVEAIAAGAASSSAVSLPGASSSSGLGTASPSFVANDDDESRGQGEEAKKGDGAVCELTPLRSVRSGN